MIYQPSHSRHRNGCLPIFLNETSEDTEYDRYIQFDRDFICTIIESARDVYDNF